MVRQHEPPPRPCNLCAFVTFGPCTPTHRSKQERREIDPKDEPWALHDGVALGRDATVGKVLRQLGLVVLPPKR
jgi:hypothetical protein